MLKSEMHPRMSRAPMIPASAAAAGRNTYRDVFTLIVVGLLSVWLRMTGLLPCHPVSNFRSALHPLYSVVIGKSKEYVTQNLQRGESNPVRDDRYGTLAAIRLGDLTLAPSSGIMKPEEFDTMTLNYPRRRTREVRVGNVMIGGEHPMVVQPMITEETLRGDYGSDAPARSGGA
jgi:hypothetical protein